MDCLWSPQLLQWRGLTQSLKAFYTWGEREQQSYLLIGSIVSAFCLSTRATKECFSGNSSGRDLKCEPRFHCVNKYQAGRKGLLKVILSPYLQMGTFLLFTESSLLWALELLPCSSPFPSPNLSGFSLVSESGKPWSSNKAVQSQVLWSEIANQNKNVMSTSMLKTSAKEERTTWKLWVKFYSVTLLSTQSRLQPLSDWHIVSAQ